MFAGDKDSNMTHVAQRYAPEPATDFRSFAAAGPKTDAEGQRIRLQAAELFRQGRVQEAHRLTHEALQQHPDSPDVLVMYALLCEVCHDWATSATVLEHLLALQGASAPVEAWLHWVRVLRCDGQHPAAWHAALQALEHHPDQPDLVLEIAQLEVLGFGPLARAA